MSVLQTLDLTVCLLGRGQVIILQCLHVVYFKLNMTKTKVIGFSLVGAGLALAIGYGVYSWFKSRQPTAGLKVYSTPQALVFVDNVQIGQTPLEKLFPPGEVTVKIIPDTLSTISPYQAKIRLTANAYTVIRRDFGDSDVLSAGEITSLLKESGPEASLSVVSSYPDSAAISLDGQPQGFTPLLISPVSPGDHQITLTAPGFTDRVISALAIAGYRLTLTVKLAGLPAPIISLPTPTLPATSSATLSRPYVTILDTPTGFLRVRSAPSTTASESGRVKPKENYPLLKSEPGWYLIKVKLEATSSGWISSQYAKAFQ